MTPDPVPTPPAPGRSPAFRLVVALLVISGLTLIVRRAPWFDAGVEELCGRLTVLRDATIAARERPGEWTAFAEQARSELRQIADDARRTQQRRSGPWRWIAGFDRREDAALKEVQRLAENEFPALIGSGPTGNALRERNVVEALGRLDDHLAGLSPYLPPMRPIEQQAGMDRTTGVRRQWPAWVVVMIIVDVLVVGGGLWWWIRRGAARKTTVTP